MASVHAYLCFDTLSDWGACVDCRINVVLIPPPLDVTLPHDCTIPLVSYIIVPLEHILSGNTLLTPGTKLPPGVCLAMALLHPERPCMTFANMGTTPVRVPQGLLLGTVNDITLCTPPGCGKALLPTIPTDLSPCQEEELLALLQEFVDVFTTGEDRGWTHLLTYDILTTGSPQHQPPHRKNPHQRHEEARQVGDMLGAGLVEPSHGP